MEKPSRPCKGRRPISELRHLLSDQRAVLTPSPTLCHSAVQGRLLRTPSPPGRGQSSGFRSVGYSHLQSSCSFTSLSHCTPKGHHMHPQPLRDSPCLESPPKVSHGAAGMIATPSRPLLAPQVRLRYSPCHCSGVTGLGSPSSPLFLPPPPICSGYFLPCLSSPLLQIPAAAFHAACPAHSPSGTSPDPQSTQADTARANSRTQRAWVWRAVPLAMMPSLGEGQTWQVLRRPAACPLHGEAAPILAIHEHDRRPAFPHRPQLPTQEAGVGCIKPRGQPAPGKPNRPPVIRGGDCTDLSVQLSPVCHALGSQTSGKEDPGRSRARRGTKRL